MNLIISDNKYILLSDKVNDLDAAKSKIESGDFTYNTYTDYIRLEHPHCAFFKSTHSSGENEYKRTTLYTQEGRLHIDFENKDGSDVQIDKYVKKKENLDLLLIYLRDVEVKPLLKQVEGDFQAIIMPKTPMAEFVSYVSDEIFEDIINDYEIVAKHIMNQFRRIYNDIINLLSQKASGKADMYLFDDVRHPAVNEQLMEKWHHYYARKARLLDK